MRKIEATMAEDLRAYIAAFGAFDEEAGAASLDVASGVAAYTGAGSPLTTVKGVGPNLTADELDAIEAFAAEHGSPPLPIEVSPWPIGETEALLEERGYRVVDREDVVATTSTGPALPPPTAVELEAEAWTALQLRIAEADEGVVEPVLAALMAVGSHLAGATNLALAGPEGWIAVGQSVAYGDVVVLGDDATRPTARRRGAQTTLIRERLDAVDAGRLVVAEVAPGSISERNYLRSGFELAYTRRTYAVG